MSNPFSPWWYYEMGKMDTEHSSNPRKKSATSHAAGSWVILVAYWAVVTLTLAIILWIMATIFGGLDFWLCLIICGIFSLWLCTTMAS